MSLALAGLALFGLGVGIGNAFRHLSTRVLSSSSAADNDRTSAALGVVQLFASGFGAAIGGAAGLPLARGIADVEGAARTLFIVFAAIIALGIPLAVLVSRRDAARALPQPAEGPFCPLRRRR